MTVDLVVTLWWMVGAVLVAGASGWAVGGPVGSVGSVGAAMTVIGVAADAGPSLVAGMVRRRSIDDGNKT